MSTTLPVRADLLDHDFQIDLDATTYTLRFRWNNRDFAWYMDVAEEDGTLIRSSLKVVVDVPLGARCRDSRWPPGAFLAIDTGPRPHRDPQAPEELSDRVLLVYFSKDELPVDPTTVSA